MTPIQTILNEIQVNIDLYGLAGNKAMLKAYGDIQARLKELLPVERQFAQNIFNAGRDREWSVRFGKVPPTEPSFEDYYKQFDL